MRRLWSPSPDMLDRRSLQVQDESVLLVGVTVVPGTKYWRWPLSLSVISGHGAGRTYPTPAGGVVRNQEISLGGQQLERYLADERLARQFPGVRFIGLVVVFHGWELVFCDEVQR